MTKSLDNNNDNDNFKYFISKDIISNKDINDIDLLILLILNSIYPVSINSTDYISFDLNSIYYHIYHTFEFKPRDIKLIKDSIYHLIDLGLINIRDKYVNCYIIDSCDLYIDSKSSKYISINGYEFDKIISFQAIKYKLLRYYLNIISTINNKSKIGFTSIDKLAEMSFIQKSTAINYNTILEDSNLLFVARSNLSLRYDDGTIRKSSNTYGKFIDRDIIIKNFENYNNTVVSINGKDVDYIDRRSIKPRYNHFVKCINNNTKYKRDIKELYEDCIKYNRSLSESDISSGDMNKLDLEVFDGKV